MNIWTNIKSSSGEAFRFRRLHPQEIPPRKGGLVALTTVVDFEVKFLELEAANDLAEACGTLRESNPQHYGCGVAICLVRGLDLDALSMIAANLRDLHIYTPPSEAA